MQYRSAIVTGGSGFIGSHLVDALIAQGTQVTVIDKVDPPEDRKNAQAEYVRIQVQDDAVRGVFARVKPDIIFHFAAHIDDRESLLQPVVNAEDNIIGSLNVFEAARLVNVKKIVFASTGVVYGNVTELPTSESVLPKPLTPYAVSKLTGERYLNFYWLLYKMPYAALRLSNVYGPRQDASKECGFIAIATERQLKGESIFVNNDGMTTRDYIHVSDVVRACLLAAASGSVGVWNIATGVETSTNDVLAKVAAAVGTTPNTAPRPEVQDMVKRVALNPAKAWSDLGWSAEVSIDDGIKDTVAWYKDQQ